MFLGVLSLVFFSNVSSFAKEIDIQILQQVIYMENFILMIMLLMKKAKVEA